MRHDPSAAQLIMLRSLKLHGMARPGPIWSSKGAPAFEAAVPICRTCCKAEGTTARCARSATRCKAAKFPAHRDLAGFDFARQ